MAPAVSAAAVKHIQDDVMAATNGAPDYKNVSEAVSVMRSRLKGLPDEPSASVAALALRPMYDLLFALMARAGLDNEQVSGLCWNCYARGASNTGTCFHLLSVIQLTPALSLQPNSKGSPWA